MAKGALSIEQKQGIIMLTTQKKVKTDCFKINWRPIGLFNIGYKDIINDDLKGRYIEQNVRILKDVTFLLKKSNHQ